MHRRALSLLALCLTLVACGDDGLSTSPDAAADDAATTCTSDAECDDGLFCNGFETCSPDEPGASARGCVAGSAPCAGRCDDALDRCLVGCDVPDADGDGSIATECGGDDCDDGDRDRFPGNVELCDAIGRDEDCDPTTLGHDLDRDGYVDDRCCNVQPEGGLLCGEDCNDLQESIRPGAIDVCNGRDDDCDGRIDEEPTLVFYRDADGDGWGVAGDPDDASLPDDARPVRSCVRPDGYSVQPGDCDDTNVRAAPGSLELCGGGDEDCDGRVDEYGEGVATPAIDPSLWYRDDDRDGWGNTDRVALGCRPPSDGLGYSSRLGDCRDDRPDVHPGVTTPMPRPSCPESYASGDTVILMRAFRCGARWECVPDYGDGNLAAGCGQYPFLDAHWDLDCSGRLETSPTRPVYFEYEGACAPFSESRPTPEQCGLGTTFPEAYGPPSYPGCEATPIGALGPVRCR